LFSMEGPCFLISGSAKSGPFWLTCWHTLYLVVRSQARCNFVGPKWVVSWKSFISICPRDWGRICFHLATFFIKRGLSLVGGSHKKPHCSYGNCPCSLVGCSFFPCLRVVPFLVTLAVNDGHLCRKPDGF
jgi:hypothetical protein